MIKLSDRLQRIAERIRDSKTMADIGTDHGFLPIYMLQSGRCEKVIATDISEPSLAKSVKNAKEAGDISLTNFEPRVGDGLSVIAPGEVETVVIAGMGGRLIRDILSNDFGHTCSFMRFVFQPRTGQGVLRKWLCESGFTITAEDLVYEGDYIPEIITVLSPGVELKPRGLNNEYEAFIAECDEDDIGCLVPPWLKNADGPAETAIERHLEREQKILKNMRLSKSRDIKKEARVRGNIEYITELLQEVRREKQKENRGKEC